MHRTGKPPARVRPDHFLDHEDWFQQAQKSSIRTGSDLVAQVSAMYPNVELGLDAQKELAALSGTERHFGWVIERLESANRDIVAWTAGAFPHGNLPGPASGESESVRRSPSRMRMRVFASPTGEPVQFRGLHNGHRAAGRGRSKRECIRGRRHIAGNLDL